MLRTRQLAGAIAASLLFSTAVAAADFNQVIVFGDSLSDNGNLSQVLPPAGLTPPLRFTTNPGTVAIENVANGLGAPIGPSLSGGTDFAWGVPAYSPTHPARLRQCRH